MGVAIIVQMRTDEELHRHWAESLAQADALLFGRVTYAMLEATWRPPARTGVAITTDVNKLERQPA